MTHQVDVAIVGGGLAGNLLARQLRREVPRASVAIFERETERSWKVGESTVEIATDYLTRRLGLTRYLYERHLPKNGLRFFFDTEARDAELHQMSEIGLMGLPPYPSFQLDRARLEADLLEMNAEDGVDVHVGARVSNLTLDGTGHSLTVVEGDEQTQWRARWVIDGTGRAGMIARLQELKVPEPGHRVAASWGRFRNVSNMDDWHDEDWMARVRHTARYLQVNTLVAAARAACQFLEHRRPGGSIVRIGDAQSVQAVLQPVEMFCEPDQSTGIRRNDFVNSVAEQEPAVEHREGRLRGVGAAAVHRDEHGDDYTQ